MIAGSIQAIVSDLDGTLLDNDGMIDSKTIKILKQFQKNGGFFIIATSRHLHECKNIAREVLDRQNGFLICSNGMYLYDGENTLLKTFPYLDMQDIYTICDKYRDGQITFVTDGADYIWQSHNSFIHVIKNTIINICVNLNPIKKQNRYMLKELDDLEKPIEKIIVKAPKIKDKYFDNNQLNIFVFDKIHLVEFQNINTDKAKAVEYLLKVIGITRNNVVVFGDDGNDKPLFKQFTNSIAMGNSNEELKTMAKYVTLSNCEQGVYSALIEMGI